MDTFYDKWLGGIDIHSAFRETQLAMSKKYKNEPFKWAGFILTE
jgi:CHAT domain-containing protein